MGGVGAFMTLAIVISTSLRGRSAYAEAGRGWKGIAKAIKQVGFELITLAGIMAINFITAATRAFTEFESIMAQVNAVSGATVEQFGLLREKALELARTTQFTATEVAQAMFFMTQAGLSYDETLGNVASTLQLAQIGVLELGKSSDILTDIMRGMQLETKDMGHVTDVLAKTFASFNTTVEQLGVAMSFAAPLASQLGVSLEETAAAIGILSSAGIKGERAGTTVRNILANLIEPSTASKRVLDELGISVRDQQGNFRKLADIIEQFSAAGATAEQVMQIFQKRAGPGFLALMDQVRGSDRALVDFTETLVNSQGEAKRMADIIEASPIAKFKKFKSKLEEFMIRMGGFFFPMIEKFMDLIFPPDKGGKSPFLESLGKIVKSSLPFISSMVTLIIEMIKLISSLAPVFKLIMIIILTMIPIITQVIALVRVIVESVMLLVKAIGFVGGAIGLGTLGSGALGIMSKITSGTGGIADYIGGIGGFQSGGRVNRNQLAFLHAGEYVVNPKAGQTVNNRGEMIPGQGRRSGGSTMYVTNNFYGQSASNAISIERNFLKMKRKAEYQ